MDEEIETISMNNGKEEEDLNFEEENYNEVPDGLPDIPEAKNPVELLQQILTGQINFDEGISTIAKGFSAFVDNNTIYDLPDEILLQVINHQDINFPIKAEDIGNFFIKIIQHGPNIAKAFFDSIPFDDLNISICNKIMEIYQKYNLKREVHILQKFLNFFESLQKQSNELEELKSHFAETASQLQKSNDLLEKMTVLLRSQTSALTVSAFELEQKPKK